MIDSRVAKAADILVNYSTKVQAGERVIINCSYDAKPLVLEVYRLCLKNKAYPKIKCSLDGEAFVFYRNATEEQLKYFPEEEFFEVQKADVVMFISGSSNTKELSSIDPAKISLRRKALEKIQKWRVDKTRWVLYNYPSSGLAQDAEMSMSEFEDFTFSATNVDYAKMSKWQDKLKKILDEGSSVHITGPETDLKLSIKGRQAIKGCGSHNVPDGEVFIAPDEFSAEGHIYYDVTAVYGGKEVSGIRLWFEKGKVVKATAEKNESLLHKMIAMDEGSCRLGELGIGTNYEIKRPIKQILFDEKIGGSVHLALGSAYKEGGGKNESGLHWDMIKDLRKGGSLSVDGKVIQKDGKFKI